MRPIFPLLAFCFGLSVQFVAADITIYDVQVLNQTGITAVISASIAGVTPLDVINGATEYVVTEVASLIVAQDSKGDTATLLSTPATISIVLEEANTIIANTIFDTLTSVPPTATAIEFGFAGCAPLSSSPLASGVQVECFEFLTESNLGESTEQGTTIGYSGVLVPIFTITQTTINPTTENQIGPATFASTSTPNPGPTTPMPPKHTGNSAKRDAPHGAFIVTSLFLLSTFRGL